MMKKVIMYLMLFAPVGFSAVTHAGEKIMSKADREEINKAITSHADDFKNCYEHEASVTGRKK